MTLKDPNLPTLLIYHHYDVVPVEPIAQWKTPPFEPTWVGEDVWGRGVNDNKGQLFYVLLGLRALMRRDGKLPINVKMIIDGEEELASPHLPALLKSKQAEVKADYVAVIDLGLTYLDRPTLVVGIRGIVAMDISIKTGDEYVNGGGGVEMRVIAVAVICKHTDEKRERKREEQNFVSASGSSCCFLISSCSWQCWRAALWVARRRCAKLSASADTDPCQVLESRRECRHRWLLRVGGGDAGG